MNMRIALLVSLAFASVPAAARADLPSSAYEPRPIEGWTVRVNRQLLEGEHTELGEKALRLLEMRLYEINRVVPERALAVLHEVPIWLGLGEGQPLCAAYHPSRDWLVDHGFNPEKAECVEIGNAKLFVEWATSQPAMVLHELAHAYHHRAFGYDDWEISAAYRRAMDAKRYDAVLRNNGATEKAYATNNPQEFFAEASEAYFGTNDFYPFVKVELKQHDPETFALLERLWQGPPAEAEGR
jgi:hypothetical protein